MFKKKIAAVISILLCIFIVAGTVPAYAAGNSSTDAKGDTATVWFIFVNMREKASLKSSVKRAFLIGKSLEVLGYEGNFIKVKDPESKEKGYIFKWLLIDNGETKLTITTYNNIYKGDTEKDSVTIKYNGSKSITWSLDKSGVVQVTQGTEKNKLTVTGLDFGTATLTVRAGLLSAQCKLYCYYNWKQEWETKAKTATTIYKGPGSECGKKADLAQNAKFIVKGDDGGSAGWAYGYTTKNKTNYWGYVKIENISTKNTISYYRSLSWGYPLQNKAYNYINSPYAPRPSLNDKHRGFDINEKANQADIEGQAIVAAFDGVVKKVGADLNTTNGCGYYICITSKTVDPVTEKKIIAIYQHMQDWAEFSQNDTVEKGDVIGYVGNTGRSEGSHLHFEVNNWNAGIGDSGRSDFTYTINPIYFYLDMVENDKLILNMDCSAVNSGYSFYFYNYDLDEM